MYKTTNTKSDSFRASTSYHNPVLIYPNSRTVSEPRRRSFLVCSWRVTISQVANLEWYQGIPSVGSLATLNSTL